MKKEIFNVEFKDDFDKKPIKGKVYYLSTDSSMLQEFEKFTFKLFHKRREYHFRNLKNMRKYINKHLKLDDRIY